MASIYKVGKRWRAQVSIRGIRQTEVFPTKQQASAWALDKEASGRVGKIPNRTLGDALMRYAAEVAPKRSGEAWEVTRCKAMARLKISDILLKDLDRSDLARWRDDRLKTVKPATVLRDINLLRSVFKTCIGDWNWLKESPLKGLSMPKPPKGTGGCVLLNAAAHLPVKRGFADCIRHPHRLGGFLRGGVKVERLVKESYSMSVSIGIGTSSKQKQIQNAMMLLQIQQQASQAAPGLVQPQNAYNSLEDLLSAMDKKDPTRYFTPPDQMPPQQPQPDPAMLKVQAESQAKMAELQQQGQLQAQKQQGDVEVERMKQEFQAQQSQAETQLEAQRNQMQSENELTLAREKAQLEFNLAVTKAQMQQETAITVARINAEAKILSAKTMGAKDALKLQNDMNRRANLLRQAEDNRLQIQAMQENHTKREREELAQAGHKALLDALPEWNDPGKYAAESAAVARYLTQNGYADDDLNNLYDHRAVLIARKAMLYDQQQAVATKKVAPPVKEPPKPVKSGNANVPVQTTKDAELTALQKKFKKTGKDDDAVAFLLARSK